MCRFCCRTFLSPIWISWSLDIVNANGTLPYSPSQEERYFSNIVSGDAKVRLSQSKQVPSFFTGRRAAANRVHGPVNDITIAHRATLVLSQSAPVAMAVGFGAVHFIAWSDDFRYPLERRLWRYSTIIITVLPGFLCLLLMSTPLIGFYLDKKRSERNSWLISASQWGKCKRVLYTLCFIVGGPVYIVARIVLMVLPLMALSSLTEASFQTVQWTTFLPHL